MTTASPRKAPARRRAAAGATAAPATQRDRLRARERPTDTHTFLIDEKGVAAARDALTEAQGLHRQARLTVGKTRERAIRTAEKAVATAQAAMDACYEVVVFRAMPPDEVEELKAAHPPTPVQLDAVRVARELANQRGENLPPWPDWNEDTYPGALMAACSENGMTADDWHEFLKENVSTGERASLWKTVVAVNQLERIADPVVIPKELMRMLSSR